MGEEAISDFSLTDLFYYWSLISSYVDIGSIVFWTLLGGFLGFVTVLILEIIFRKKILVRRRHKILKYIACLYFIFFPFWASFSFSQLFAFHSIKGQVINNIPVILGESNSLFNLFLTDYVEEHIGMDKLGFTTNEGVDAVVDLVSDYNPLRAISDSASSLTRAAASVASDMITSEYLKGKSKDQIAEAVSSNLSLDRESVEELMDTKINQILETGAINSYAEIQVNSIFSSLMFQAVLIFLLGIAIPLGEIVLAHYLVRKEEKLKTYSK